MPYRYASLAFALATALSAENPLAISRAQQQYSKLPLHFEPSPTAGVFSAHGGRFVVSIAGSAATIQLRSAQKDVPPARVHMQLVGALSNAKAQGSKPLAGTINFLVGNDPRQWRREIPTFAEVRVPSVRPGVDLVYYGNQSQLEYDLVVSAGTDPAPLVWAFTGHQSLSVTADGGLSLETAAGPILWRKPNVYQMEAGIRLSVPASYRVVAPDRVGFTLGAYDRRLPLTIDPVLEYSTALGGRGSNDTGRSIAVDSLGQAYVVGYTDRPDFPSLNAAYTGQPGGTDIFVTKLNAAGTGIVYSTYLGGSGTDEGLGIAIDTSSPPSAYITGSTTSTDFPVIGGAQSAYGGDTDAFIVKLSGGGNFIVYSSYHGGSGRDLGSAIGVHTAQGTAYITGWTNSANLPVVSPLQATKGSFDDGFVTKFSSAGNSRLFSTYLGGSNNDYLHGLAVDAVGNIYVTGLSASANYPNDATIQSSHRGIFDAMITKINSTGSARIYSHLLGGSGYDGSYAVAVDPTGAAYLTGGTGSPDFPVLAAHQPTLGGRADVFVTKLNPAGTALVYSTFLGGPFEENSNGIAVDSAGRALVAGHSQGRLNTLNAITPVKPGGSYVLLRSANAGGTLIPADSGLETAPGPDFPLVVFESAAVAYTFGANGDTYKSTNAGANWTTLGPAGTIQGTPRATASTSANAIWVGTSSNLYFSANGGASWAVRTNGLPASPNVTAITFNPTNAAELFVGLNSGGVYRTTDSGVSWSAVNTGLGNLAIRSLFLNPANSSEIFAGTTSRAYRTINGGASWELFGPITLSNVTTIYLHPVSGEIFGLANGGLIVSSDTGASWGFLDIPLPQVNRILVHPVNPQILLISRDSTGIWRSTNRGATWALVSEGDATALSLAFAPDNPNTLLASMVLLRDAVVARFEPNGSLNYLTYLGGSGWDMAHGIGVDPAGNAYVVGDAGSLAFPTTANAFQRLSRPQDAFVSKISAPTLPPACTYQVVPPRRTLYPSPSRAGDVVRVAAPSGCVWTAVSSAPWLSVINGSNRSGVGDFFFNVEPNSGAPNRTATLTIGSNVIPIEQAGSNCSTNTNFPSATRTFLASGGSRTDLLTIPAGCPWTAQSDVDWLTISPSAGNGSATVSITAPPNPSRASRSALVTVGPGFLNINQNGFVPGPPAVTLPEPISGTGLTKTFTFRYSNPNGYQQLGILNALINSALDGGNACYIAYSVPAGILFLVNDKGVADGLSAPLVLGTNNSVGNSQCTITGLNSSAVGSGTDFTLTLAVTFSSTFPGSKIVYLAARDQQEQNSGWSSSGFHQIPGGPVVFPNPQMTPSIGTTASGILNLTYEDQNNNANLQTLWALTNSALDGRNACYVVYFAPGNLIGIVPDNGDGGALSLIPLSGSATTGNSQCQVNTLGSSVVRSGSRLTLNLNMTFKPDFSGRRIVWMAGQTVAGQVSPWKASGAWQVPP